MPIEYREYEPFSKEMLFVESYLQKVFPDPEIREYWVSVNCGIFRGGNMDKKAIFWSGSGNNAKSITQKIIEEMLGPDYALSLSSAVLNNGRPGSGQASPDIARTGGGVRQLFVQEPDKNSDINVDVLKLLTGNDKMFARDLYESGKDTKEMQAMFKLAIICNELPSMKTADKASWERIRVIPFESLFSDNAPVDPDEQMRTKTFPIDRRFDEKIKLLCEPMAYMFIQKFLETDGIPEYEPDKVKTATELYKKCNDLIGLFLSEQVEEAKGHSITTTEMFIAYKNWHKDNTNTQNSSSNREINDRIKTRMKIKTTDYIDYRLKTDDGFL